MAEVVVEIVQKKLADAIVKETKLLGGVGTKMEHIKHELTLIKCCLQDADSKREGDMRVENWLNELRDVAYRIEDATDTFFLQVEDLRRKYPRFFQKFVKLINKPLEMPILYKLGTELDDIQNLLEYISKSRANYGIVDLPVQMPLPRAAFSKIDETEVVGPRKSRRTDKNNILMLLRPEETPRRAVITIVGMGGLGKTTLARTVYKSAMADFDYHIMLTISQQFSLTDLLRKMISKDNDSVPKGQDVDYYAGELNSFLSSRRYLIILDDVWTGDLWNELKEVLPDVKNGSRILITTRFINVAIFADSQMPPYELYLLDTSGSLDLLLKKALPYQEPHEKCPNDLLELAHKLSEKCKGLPLALIALGGILSTKELSYPAWERVLKTMNWHSEGSVFMQILGMSYEDMPYYLKACFQYLCSFPEDYVISAKSLIRMWVVEGFIPLADRPTIDMAEDCLEELSKRSMVEVLSRSVNGLIKHFQVHDILRELAMYKAGHENFVTVFSHASNDTNPNRIIRRASLQAQERNSQFMEYVGPTTRSLLLFVSEYSRTSLHCSNFRLLKVLKIVGILDGYDLKSLDELINLKYLGLTKCNNIDLSSCSFHHMKSFETLDVRQTTGKPPCDDFWRIGTLMHVQDTEYGTFFDRPISRTTLSNLQTLKWVTLQSACDVKLPILRKLGIRYESDEWVSVTNLLQTVPFLVSLGIIGFTLPMIIVYPKALPNYENLQSLYLHGIWPNNVNVEASMLPPHLLKLSLEDSNLNHNPMPELGKLDRLKKLCLQGFVFAGIGGNSIICSEGFPVLQSLKVNDEEITDFTVALGVMPKLTDLQVNSRIMLHLPPELQHVTVVKLC